MLLLCDKKMKKKSDKKISYKENTKFRHGFSISDSDKMKNILSLSSPLLVKILSYLDHQSLISVTQVCSYLWKVSSDPILWSRSRVSKQKLVSGQHLAQLLSLSRFSLLTTLDLAHLKYLFIDQTVISVFLKYLVTNTNLRRVDLSNVDLSQVPAFPLSSGLVQARTIL